MSAATMPVWHLRWTYAGHLAGCGISCDDTADAAATAEQLRLLAAASAARVCPQCLALVQATPRAAVPAAVAAVVASVLVFALLGCGMHAATHRDADDAPPVPSPSGERAEPQEYVQ